MSRQRRQSPANLEEMLQSDCEDLSYGPVPRSALWAHLAIALAALHRRREAGDVDQFLSEMCARTESPGCLPAMIEYQLSRFPVGHRNDAQRELPPEGAPMAAEELASADPIEVWAPTLSVGNPSNLLGIMRVSATTLKGVRHSWVATLVEISRQPPLVKLTTDGGLVQLLPRQGLPPEPQPQRAVTLSRESWQRVHAACNEAWMNEVTPEPPNGWRFVMNEIERQLQPEVGL